MKGTVLPLAILLLPAALAAQATSKPFRYNGSGTVFFSAGACQHGNLNVGVGAAGEGFLWRGLTLGGEAGYYRFPADPDVGYGVFMIGPGYHFVNRNKPAKIDPYLNLRLVGGAFSSGGFSGAGGLGAGANYWFKERLGLQTGVQVHVLAIEEAIVSFRVGLAFR